MSQDTDKIKIKTANTNGGGNDGNDLKNCYFLQTNQSGKYVFFDSTGTPIVTSPMPISSDGSFTFNLPGNSFDWWIPNPAAGSQQFAVTGTGSTAAASGSWANDDDGTALRAGNDPSVGSDPTGESGTFQAAAGGTVEPEDAASAAKA